MKQCPFIDECEAEATESNFKTFCQLQGLRYPSCPIYQRMLNAKKKMDAQKGRVKK
ncbi:MAG: hypothetical protein IBV52_02480 [Candidatus Bathyarchaeota archaeon]